MARRPAHDALAVVADPPPGPQDPSTTTPRRRESSLRRTTTVDLWRPEVVGGPLRFEAKGRDLRTDLAGRAEVVAGAELRGRTDTDGALRSLESDAPVDLRALLGSSIRQGFRKAIDEVFTTDTDRCSVLHLLLDDLPVAALISGYGEARERPGMEVSGESAAFMVDLCAGWQSGATMMRAVEQHGVLPIPVGPPAPSIDPCGDALAWHDVDQVAPGALRRSRRIDVCVGDPVAVHSMFRDVYRHSAGGQPTVLHEYELEATLDRRSAVVISAVARPRVLPWPDCPQAAESAERVVGHRASELREQVRRELRGVSTCTHLNDALRALADVADLAEAALA